MRHGPEFEDGKNVAVATHALLTKEHWPTRREAYGKSNDEQCGQNDW